MPRTPRITREAVLDAGMRLIDEEGLAALTMRRLGERLGTDPAMVYRLFRNKEELLEALADAVFAGAGSNDDAPVAEGTEPERSRSSDWRETLRSMGHGIRSALLAHPALIGVAVRRPPRGEATFRGIDTGLGVLLDAGLPPREAALAYQAVLFYSLGFAALEAPFASSPDGGAADQAGTQQTLASLPQRDYPHIAATVDHLYGPDLAGQFDHGLRLLIAGVAARAAATSGSRGHGAEL